jgi:hypothetical protein
VAAVGNAVKTLALDPGCLGFRHDADSTKAAGTSRCDFEDYAPSTGAANTGGAVEIAG